MSRIQTVKAFLWTICGAAMVVAVARFWHGLGATTALTDRTPWGLWIGFDVMGGVALAAGGFMVTGTVHVLQLSRYTPLLRPAVLTAFLGYCAVIVGLIFDLGLPHHIWHPIIHWQTGSALFEVAWCVILYFAVLALEVAPVVLERTHFKRALRLLRRITVPLVILGIMLSTLHQSSLGSLLLIMPHRLHPLWYSPILPLLFFISAIALGLMMVVAESLTTAWLYRRQPELSLLEGLARAVLPVLGLYFVIRCGDLVWRSKLQHLDTSLPGLLFLAEMVLTVLLPMVLLAAPGARRSRVGLGLAASLVVAGFVLNRITVSIVATLSSTGDTYFPAWTEFAVSLGVVAGAALVFFFFVEHFSVLGEEISRGRGTWKKGLLCNGPAFMVAVALAYSFLPGEARSGPRPRATPVQPAKGGETLIIDGDRAHLRVAFEHTTHQEMLGEEQSCPKCHHRDRPGQSNSTCAGCHGDMHLPTRISDLGPPKEGSSIKANNKGPAMAVGYKAAMHGLCIPCHRQEAGEEDPPASQATARRDPLIYECGACHPPAQ